MGTGKGRWVIFDKILVAVACGFISLCVISWIGELFDLPNLLFGDTKSRFNWREASFETFITLLVGAFVMAFIMKAIALKNAAEANMRMAQEELSEKNRQLREISEQKSRFLGIVSHDLRNPVATTQMSANIVKSSIDKGNPAQAMKYLNIIEEQTINMRILIDDLLDVAKIEKGKIELNKIKLDFVMFLKNNIDMCKLLAEKRGIKIDVTVRGDIPAVYFDAHRISQVLNNLMSNAIKYSFDNSSIDIEVSSAESGVTTKIIDHGVGIPEEDLKKLFNEFQVARIGPKGNETQTGLGLAISRRIINAHGGEIGVESQINKGSTFHFTLPV